MFPKAHFIILSTICMLMAKSSKRSESEQISNKFYHPLVNLRETWVTNLEISLIIGASHLTPKGQLIQLPTTAQTRELKHAFTS